MLFGHARLLIVVMALRCLTGISQVTGPVQTISPFWLVAAALDQKSSGTEKSVSMQALGGCGKGRLVDPKTHGCRGPADVQKDRP